MRKQVSQCAGCFILTAQEKPETGRKMREDLFKKACSADGIAGRPPYGMSTRMIELICWLRYEVNSMFTLSGVTESNFQSAYRRAFVWEPKARFIDPQVIEQVYQDANMDGYFGKNDELKDFLRSGPCVAAALRLQHAFEVQHSRDRCRQLIEEYAAKPLTEDMMRKACSLPARRRSDEVNANLQLPVDSTSQQERDLLLEKLTNVQQSVIEHCVKNQKSVFTKGMMRYLTLPKDHPRDMTRDSMFDALLSHELLMPSNKVSMKYKDSGFPCLVMKKTLAEFVTLQPNPEAVTLSEVHDLEAARKYLQGNADREANVACLLQYFQERAKQLKKKGKAGSHTVDKQERIAYYENLIRKVEAREETLGKLLEQAEAMDATPSKRRRRTKSGPASSSQVGQASQSDIPPAHAEVTYERSFQGIVRTRAYARGSKIGAQRLPRLLQCLVCPDTHDLDIENSVFVVLYQLISKLNEDAAIPSTVVETLESCAKDRSGICQNKLKLSVEKGKKILHAVLFGGQIPVSLRGNVFLQQLQQASIYLRWMACSLMREVYKAVVTLPDKNNPQASTLHYLYACAEDYILEAWTDCIIRHQPGHLSLHFDGVRVGRLSSEVEVSQLCQEAKEAIKEKTGFEVNIIEKHHYLFRQLCRTPAESVEQPMTDEDLHKHGNCIPLAIARLMPEKISDIKKLLQENNHKNKEAAQRGSRCYSSVLRYLSIAVTAEHELNIEDKGRYLLHTEHDGNPHCLACQVDDNCLVTVWDGVYKTTMLLDQLLSCRDKAMDASTLVTFKLIGSLGAAEAGEAKSPADALLGLHAGAGDLCDEWSQCLQNRFECQGPQPGSDDECDVVTRDEDLDPIVKAGDRLLRELRSEVDAEVGSSERNRRCCPLCPFRRFQDPGRVRHHIRSYHVDKKQFVCSGTKQLKLCCALFDNDQLRGRIQGSYLRRSSDILRATVKPPLPCSANDIDRHIRLVLTGSGPGFWSLKAVIDSPDLRRVRNFYYTRAFAELVYRELLMCHAKCKAVSWNCV